MSPASAGASPSGKISAAKGLQSLVEKESEAMAKEGVIQDQNAVCFRRDALYDMSCCKEK
jgi:hypothetical protein